MKTRSAKNKGKRLQNDVRDLILETFKELEQVIVRSPTSSFQYYTKSNTQWMPKIRVKVNTKTNMKWK